MSRWGDVLAAILFVPGLSVSIGLGLPLWLIGGPARPMLVDRGWPRLRGRAAVT